MHKFLNLTPSLKRLVKPSLSISIIGISSVMALTGCQATKNVFGKVDNGSLEYQQARQLDPLKLPAEQETAPFVPLYPIPVVNPNTLDITNESGKRYELPPPYRNKTLD